MHYKLTDVASGIRSKNSGPHQLDLDVSPHGRPRLRRPIRPLLLLPARGSGGGLD